MTRPRPPDEVAFPVTPFLDMAFQLLAFFILTYRPPSRETRIDLYLPSAPATLPSGPGRLTKPMIADDDLDLETDLIVRAESDSSGKLKRLRLGESSVAGPDELRDRLARYASVLAGKPLRVRLLADDRLQYEQAARLLGACEAAGVTSLRLAEPTERGGP